METVKQDGPLKWLVVIAVVLVSVLVVRKNLPETSAKPVSLQPTVPTARQTATPVAGDTREIEVAPDVKMTFV